MTVAAPARPAPPPPRPPVTAGRPRRRPLRVVGRWLPVLLLGGFTAFFLLAPSFGGLDPDALDLRRRMLAPGADAWLGTDSLGRDVFARLLHGGRSTLLVGIGAVAASTLIAALLGATAGSLGGAVDLGVSGLLDVVLALPGLLVTLAILGVLGVGSWALIVALVGGSWAGEARIIRGVAASVRESAYVEAARAGGAGRARILLRHILPNVATPLIVLASLNLGEVLLVVSALSFLGLGAQPPRADWGVMLADSRPVFARAPWLMLGPGLCIVAFALLANLAGDTLRARLDPHTRRT